MRGAQGEDFLGGGRGLEEALRFLGRQGAPSAGAALAAPSCSGCSCAPTPSIRLKYNTCLPAPPGKQLPDMAMCQQSMPLKTCF